VTTDHGQKPLDEPSLISHFGDTKLERTAFLIGSGPGLRRGIAKPRVVDILPTVLHQLGLGTASRWNLDGRSLSRSRPPASATATLRGRGASRRLVARLKLGARPRRVLTVTLRLPARVRASRGTGSVRLNGRPVGFVTRGGRTVIARVRGGRLSTISIVIGPVDGGRRDGGALGVTLGGRTGRLGTLSVPLRR
jgi:hypothetical protein